jgi:F-type H+-transporting ATPase subunit delta
VADDFKESEVGERYAQALFELALDAGALDAVRADLAALDAFAKESADLRRVIASPSFSVEDKSKALGAIADKAGFNALTKRFLGLLTQNRRTAALGSVAVSFRRLHDKHRGVTSALVTSAMKLTAKQLDGVKAALRQALGGDPEITTLVDPAILGGLKVKVGSRLFDASLKTKLDSLKFALKRA